MPPHYGEHIPAAPFVALLNSEIDRIAADDMLRLSELQQEAPATSILADRLGVAERTVYRYKNSLDGDNRPIETYPRNIIEDLLERLDIPFEDVYSEIAAAEDIELEPDRYCAACKEIVTPIDGVCPWCQRTVVDEIPRRRYCYAEDRMVFPTTEGKCWRCGGELRSQIPRRACECGCGQMVIRFDYHGRGPIRFIRGHNPKSMEQQTMVPLGPFAAYLEQQVRDVDPLQAVASKHHLRREDLVAFLRGAEAGIERNRVQSALWAARNYGQEKHKPRALGVKFSDLYPDDVRSRICPECNGTKSPKGERCKQCAKRRRRTGQAGLDELHIGEHVFAQAKRLRYVERLSMVEVADRLLGLTPHTSVPSLAATFSLAFKSAGLPVGKMPVAPLPDAILNEAKMLREGRGLSFAAVARILAPRVSGVGEDGLTYLLRRDFQNRGWWIGRVDRGEHLRRAA